MNDRFLRRTVIGLGGKAMGVPREDGFDITAASEVMAILCLSRDYADLKAAPRPDPPRLRPRRASRVYARDLGAEGAMAALLRDALLPNLVQTTEGAPALVHGGPFGNIAHGCNSIVATRLALRRADVVFTEAGFGFDLGAEKFLDIKCRAAGIWPHAVVLVATLRALKFHGGVPAAESGQGERGRARPAASRTSRSTSRACSSSAWSRSWPSTSAPATPRPSSATCSSGLQRSTAWRPGLADVFGQGGAGATALAENDRGAGAGRRRRSLASSTTWTTRRRRRSARSPAPSTARPTWTSRSTAQNQLDRAVKLGFGEAPICMAKTHLSLSDDEKRVGRPRDFEMTVREVRLAAGAGFLVPLTGEIMTMPGLAKRPHAEDIDLTADGTIVGVE